MSNKKSFDHNKQQCLQWIITILIIVQKCDGLAKQITNEIQNTDDDRLLYKTDYTELAGGSVVGERTLKLSESPYLLTGDLDVERNAKLIVEPGVNIHFAPMIGITVRGVLISVVSNIYTFINC